MIELLDKIFNSKITKTIFSYVVLIILFLVFKNRINIFITKYLTVEEQSLEQLSVVWFLLIGFIAIVYSVYKFQLKRYQPSSNLLHSIFLAVLLFSILRFTIYCNGWQFISIKSTCFYYIDFLGLPIIISTFIILLRLLKKYIIKQKEAITINPFVADDPIESEFQDKLNYKKRAKDLISYLERSNFKKSFTIGIVGPWGNGKSSLIALMEKEFEQTPLKETLHIKFSPYLNHNENDIISEFFKQLSSEIGKYSGQLSNQILNYSEKLLKLYKNKNIKEFLTINSPSFSDSSSYDTYKKINSTLEDLNKKFIVFVDDLDRLSNKEVLQVLKLVRNTANFKNFIFIMALDKDYVLNILMQKNDISDHTFVDKFFQLEVYLPEIDKTQLKEDFAEFLKISDLRLKEDFILKATKAIYRKDNLFDDYISNHRGLKRLVNQLVFDFHSLPDQLNTNDFLNFTYLKMAFPSAIKFLNNNWSDLLPYNPETKLCELEEVKNEDNNNGSFDILRNSRLYFGGGSYVPDYSKYKISSSLAEEVELGKLNNLGYHQNLLLAKTLIVLFGKGNETEEYTSIKFGSNLRKLLQQKIIENELSSTEFEDVFKADNKFISLKRALQSGQTQNILDRINFYNTDNIDRVKSVIMVLLIIFNEAEIYNTYSTTVLQTLSKFIARVLSKEKNNGVQKQNEEIWKTIKREFLDGDYEIERKLEFLAFLSENRIRMSFDDWGTDENTLKELSLQQYKNLLKLKNHNLWEIYDYSFYHAYHSARKFQTEDVLNPITIDFWEKNDVSILCAQMTENDAFTVKVFKTSDFASQLFGSKTKYKSFIEKRIGRTEKKELKEYLDFIKLESYTGFRYYIRYEFVHFEMINLKMKKISNSNNLRDDELENIVEIFIESKDEETHKITGTNINKESISGIVHCLMHPRVSGYYTSVRIESSYIHKAISELLKHYANLLKIAAETEDYLVNIDEMRITKGQEIVIEFVSVQPESYLKTQ
tara:strand:+ start:1516 stop:4491 length:2976 start_codon:yes stop_codon:yes gene_type:complete